MARDRFSANQIAEKNHISKGFSTCLQIMGLTECGQRQGSRWIGERPTNEAELLQLAIRVKKFTLDRQVNHVVSDGDPVIKHRQRRLDMKSTEKRWIVVLDEIGNRPDQLKATDITSKHSVGSGFITHAIRAGVVSRDQDGYLRLLVKADRFAIRRIRKEQHNRNAKPEELETKGFSAPIELHPNKVKHSILWGLYTWESWR